MTRPWHRFYITILACTAVAVLSGCSAGQGPGISVSDPMARPSPLAGGTGGAFMVIRNGGRQADRLRSASTPAASSVELHETVNDNGVMRMVPQPDGWAIEPGAELVLEPGGKHLMLIDLDRPLQAGDMIELTLNFDKAGPVKVAVPVKAPD
jgi:copper(I)-binding protein